jgi:hypothetical protein
MFIVCRKLKLPNFSMTPMTPKFKNNVWFQMESNNNILTTHKKMCWIFIRPWFDWFRLIPEIAHKLFNDYKLIWKTDWLRILIETDNNKNNKSCHIFIHFNLCLVYKIKLEMGWMYKLPILRMRKKKHLRHYWNLSNMWKIGDLMQITCLERFID